MKHFTSTILFLVLSIVNLLAIPAIKTSFIVNQSDGKTLTFVIRGDENSHHRETLDGFRITQNESGDWVYVIPNNEDLLLPSSVLAHNQNERGDDETAFLQQIDKTEYPHQTRVKRTTNAVKRTVSAKRSGELSSTPSHAKILIVLAQYSDVRFKISSPQPLISNQLNQTNYTGNNGTGSARDYYIENSDGNFIPQFDVIGPVTLSKPMSYYGGNNTSGYDKFAGTMVSEAAQLAANLTDFSQYDLNHDGKVDKLIVIYAGYNEAEGGPSASIWPHSWNLTDASTAEGFSIPTIDGVTLDDYACTSELAGASGTNMAGIGTICHEFGHVIGLPDIYDTNYDQNGQSPAMGYWSLMDSGGYLNGGKTPPYLTAFEREMLGWADVTVLENAGTYSLAHIKQGGQVYRINSSVANEYFLLENRQKTGWDTYLPGHGMLITHVDMTNSSYLYNNTLNADASHERIDLKEAGGPKKSGSYNISSSSDPYPGALNKTSFDNSTAPSNSILWNGTGLNKPIFSISEVSGVIVFSFIGQSVINAPMANQASNLSGNSFIANWNNVTNAQNYFIDVYTKAPKALTPTMNETFSEIGSAAREPMSDETSFEAIGLRGWTGSGVYAGSEDPLESSNDRLSALKFNANENESSYVIFPVELDGNSTISICSKDWKTECGEGDGSFYKIYHSPNGDDNFELIANSGDLDCNVFCGKDFEIPNGTYYSKIKIEVSGGRALIESVKIESGAVGIISYLPGYKNLNVGNVSSFSVSNLPNPTDSYYYVVRASNGTNISANSNEIAVNLLGSKINTAEESTLKIYKNGNTLYIESTTNINNIEVYNPMGYLVKKQIGKQGTNTVELNSNQVYIVKIDGKAVKILM